MYDTKQEIHYLKTKIAYRGKTIVRLNEELDRYKADAIEELEKVIELHSRQCNIDTLRTELSRRDSAITHRDKEIFKLECKAEELKKTALDWENRVRMYQGRRPFEYPHPPRPRFTRGGQQLFAAKGDWDRSYYINDGGQRVAEFKSRELRDRVVDDLNEED